MKFYNWTPLGIMKFLIMNFNWWIIGFIAWKLFFTFMLGAIAQWHIPAGKYITVFAAENSILTGFKIFLWF